MRPKEGVAYQDHRDSYKKKQCEKIGLLIPSVTVLMVFTKIQ